MTILLSHPATRINDFFVKEGSSAPINFSDIPTNFNDSIVKGRPNVDFRFQAGFYKKIGVDIVTETCFNYPYPFLTEKTYRAFSSFRPFILVAPYQSIAFVKSMGFKTFSSIIDESYDDIKDPELRFVAVCNSIKTFVLQPIAKIKQDLHSISLDLMHNQAHLSKLFLTELENFKNQL
jgi:hypothetical protein